MKKHWKSYHLPSEAEGKSLCGRTNVVIISKEEWNIKMEMTKCKTCSQINNTNLNII